MLSRDHLPTTTEQLRELCLALHSTIVEKDNALSAKEKIVKDKQTRIDYLEEQLNLLRSKRYQSSSETLNHLQSQLFDESELEVAIQDARDSLSDMQTEPNLDDESSQALVNTNYIKKIFDLYLGQLGYSEDDFAKAFDLTIEMIQKLFTENILKERKLKLVV